MNGHLAFEELIAPAEETMPHLAACAACAAQAAEWAALGSGVRLLGFDDAAPAGPYQQVLAAVDAPVAQRGLGAASRLARLRQAVAARRPAALAGVTAAAAVLAAGGYGLSASLASGAPPGHTATLTAGLISTGCTGLKLAAGQLDQVNGDELVLTAANGTRVTVTTTTGTTIRRVTAGSVSDIADGDNVLVNGQSSGLNLTADSIAVLPGTTLAADDTRFPGLGLATGKVSDVSGSGFTVTTVDGTAVTVTTTSSTVVIESVSSGLSDLRAGELTTVSGTQGTDGTLIAESVQQDDVPSADWQKVQPSPPSVPGGTLKVAAPSGQLNGLGCAPEAVTTSYLLSHES